MEKILKRIKLILINEKLTIAQLERETDISPGTISKWNKAVPKIDTLEKVADFLGVSLDYLVKGIDNNSNCNNKTNSSIIGNDNNNNIINGANTENEKPSKQEQMIVEIYRQLDAEKQMEIFQNILYMKKHINNK